MTNKAHCIDNKLFVYSGDGFGRFGGFGSIAARPAAGGGRIFAGSQFCSFFAGGFSDCDFGDMSALLNTRRARGEEGRGGHILQAVQGMEGFL